MEKKWGARAMQGSRSHLDDLCDRDLPVLVICDEATDPVSHGKLSRSHYLSLFRPGSASRCRPLRVGFRPFTYPQQGFGIQTAVPPCRRTNLRQDDRRPRELSAPLRELFQGAAAEPPKLGVALFSQRSLKRYYLLTSETGSEGSPPVLFLSHLRSKSVHTLLIHSCFF